MSVGKSKSKSESKVLTPDQVAGYFSKLNSISNGKLNSFAQGDNAYQGASVDQIKSLGGLGATRTNELTQNRDRVNKEYGSDASLSVLQKLRAQQLNNNSANSALDAINKETEAAISNFSVNNDITKNKLRREDLTALANIFFGGKGQNSSGKASGFNVAFAKPKP